MFSKLTKKYSVINFYRCQHNWIQPTGYDTKIKVYNCRVKEKVPLIVKNKDKVSWYTCGPTVYDSAHIGHASCYVKFDIIKRILKQYFKLNIINVMNITDIDDKIIKRSNEMKVSACELARKYENEFWSNLEDLNVNKPDIILRVTNHIPTISNFVQNIIDKNRAYVASDKSVYFDLSKCENYGKLVPFVQTETENGAKKSVGDFAVWKNSKVNEPSWGTSFGIGRPAWHSECSALASAVFGNQLDFHAGGIDLKFPHHENEEAISCAYHKTNQWVNYWLHSGHLNLVGEIKMSKSLGNCLYIKDILNNRQSAGDIFRMSCVMSNYRANMEYSEKLMNTAEAQLNKFLTFFNECDNYMSRVLQPAVIDARLLNDKMMEVKQEIDAALKDDFNTAQTIKSLSELINFVNKMFRHKSTTNNLNDCVLISIVKNFVGDYFQMLGFKSAFKQQNTVNINETASILDVLITFRQNVRNIAIQTKDNELLKNCDNLRNELKLYGVEIKDRGKISSWNN